MHPARLGDTVRVHFTIRHEDGTEAETSGGGEPIAFTIGEREVIPVAEETVYGMRPGETKVVRFNEDTGFGPYLEPLRLTLNRSLFPAGEQLQVGEAWTVSQTDGHSATGRITGITAENVIIDTNNRFAGKSLELSIELLEIL